VTRTFVVGARGSALSLRQVEIVVAALRAQHPALSIDVHQIKTEGDVSRAPLSEIGGTGVFTKAIEDALLARTIDIAVHSLKDLPPLLPAGLVLGATPERGDVRDALVARGGLRIAQLPAGARIGTGSERRSAQLLALRPDVVPVAIRGNVPTRIAKVESGEYDAAVLAIAGLTRLGLMAKATQVFSIDEMMPAVGQAALGIEVRTDDAETLDLVRAIDHEQTRAAVTAERAFLARLGAGCRMPVGGYAAVDADGRLWLRTFVVAEDGIAHHDRQPVQADPA
jgi:hydroxymethylbilane synthase